MKILAILAVLICCILMFVVKRPYKGGIIILSTMLFTAVYIPSSPIHTANLAIILSFLISELGHIKEVYQKSKGTIVWKLMGLSLFISIITIMFSPHLRDANNIRIMLQNYLFIKDFGLIYAFWCFKDMDSLKPTLKITFWGLLVLTGFGIINFLTKQSDFVSAAATGMEETGMHLSGSEAGSAFTHSDRFRVQAMFVNPFDYGYICIIILLLHIYGYNNRMEKRNHLIIVILCSIFGILTCGSRTVLFCSMIGLATYIMLGFNLNKTLKYIVITFCLFCISYLFIPEINDKVSNMMSMFDKNSKVEGSSIEMRTMQYAAVMYHIQDSPIVGKGYGYFYNDLGWGDDIDGRVDTDLWGLEGVIMSKLLERGFLGLFLYLIFYISLVAYFIKNRNISKSTCALGLSLLCTYFSFSNMTGELSSVFPTLLSVGFCISAIEYKKKFD